MARRPQAVFGVAVATKSVALESFWRRVSDAALLSPLRRGPLEILTGRWTLDYSPVFAAFDLAARVLSPYDLNPLGVNPLRQILTESVDFARLAAARSACSSRPPTGGRAAAGSSATPN